MGDITNQSIETIPIASIAKEPIDIIVDYLIWFVTEETKVLYLVDNVVTLSLHLSRGPTWAT
jgi:hypothetical protein